MIPNTFIIGAMKSATTSVCDILSQHPDAFICSPKEPDFFSRDAVYAKGTKWYASLFRSAEPCRVVGDGSTSYTKQLQFPNAASRLAAFAPDARLIYMARHPVKRIQSHWAHEVLKGRTNLSLEEFVRTHPEAIDISCYWRQISRYRDHFPDAQIRVLFFEDFCRSAQDVIDQCCDFLELSRFEIADLDVDQNQSSQRRKDIAPIRMLRKYRWFDVRLEQVKQRTPGSIQTMLKRLLKSGSGAGSPRWTPDFIQWVQDQLADDNSRFLLHYGKPSDFWFSSDDTPGTGSAFQVLPQATGSAGGFATSLPQPAEDSNGCLAPRDLDQASRPDQAGRI